MSFLQRQDRFIHLAFGYLWLCGLKYYTCVYWRILTLYEYARMFRVLLRLKPGSDLKRLSVLS